MRVSETLGAMLLGVLALALVAGIAAPGAAATGLSPAAATHLKQALDAATGETHFVPPGPPIDPAPLKGRLIFTIPVSTAIPFCSITAAKLGGFATKLGLRSDVWQNSAQLPQWVQGVSTAMSRRAALINLFCGLDPAAVAPQVRQARAAGIPVVAAHDYALGQPALPGLSGVVYGAYVAAAKLEADWVIQKTGGAADVLVITAPGIANSPYNARAIKSEFAAWCPACKLRTIGINAPDWGSKIGPSVQSAILSHPNLNYVIAIYDGMVPAIVPAIIGTGAAGRVKVATFNATPAVLDMIRTGNIVTFDVGEDTTWLAGAMLDQDMRVLLHKPLIADYAAGLRAFMKANVAAAGVPAKFGEGYGASANAGYLKLWGQP